MQLPLHGIGGRQDLPIPFGFAVTGAGVAIALSFVILAVAWRSPKYRGAQSGVPLPAVLRTAIDSAWLRWAVRLFGLAAFFWAGLALLAGVDRLTNPIFGVVYILVWVGLVPVSLFLGPVWRTLNPLRTLHLLACKALRHDPRRGLFELAPKVGLWPATVGIFAFAWLELVAPDRATLPVLQAWLSLYVVFVLFGAVLFGDRWFAAADPFEAYATLMAKLSPWGRRNDGVLVVRRPLENLDTLTPKPGLVGLVAALLGSTAYDGFSRSSRWIAWSQDSGYSEALLGTLALAGFVMFVLVTYSAATVLAGRMSDSSRTKLPGLFAHSVVPIVLGYVVAHYLTLLILEGQRTINQLSDPLSRGWNVFGTGLNGVNAEITNHTTAVSTIQVGAVVIGHLLGVVSAHDRAVALFPRNRALAGQIPLLVVMVAYTTGGLILLFSA
ncbi:hypothetical protein HPO96_37305 [Kribbella sandramycini]|uniref:Fenitrothion hydrolase n=1 Tax=Kribbella sandramycini TaxID=60450 RepID=A0A7Y4P539_9ACTN|nr:hypothetical protein [Kribbella sandramycini]MBB6570228.1 hypothetical protein [Kribbella sandramycini]NOL45919.1 hypothetical protein [Kribbella sandramycini]